MDSGFIVVLVVVAVGAVEAASVLGGSVLEPSNSMSTAVEDSAGVVGAAVEVVEVGGSTVTS